MISALRKLVSSPDVGEPVCAEAGDAQPAADDGRQMFAERTSDWWHGPRPVTARKCQFDEANLSIVSWKMGTDSRWVRRVVNTLLTKLPKNPAPPKLLNGVKFVLDIHGNPVTLQENAPMVTFLVTAKNKLRALKVAYKDAAGDKEMIYEGVLHQHVASAQATAKFYGLVAIDSPFFARSGLLIEFLGDQKGSRPQTLKDVVNHQQSQLHTQTIANYETQWKNWCIKLCEDIAKLQQKGLRILDLHTGNLVLNRKRNKFVLNDLSMAVYKDTPLLFDVGDTPAKEFFHQNPCMAPELYYNSYLHINNATYSLARVMQSMALCAGLRLDKLKFLLEAFVNIDPHKRPTVIQLKNMLKMYLEIKKNFTDSTQVIIHN